MARAHRQQHVLLPLGPSPPRAWTCAWHGVVSGTRTVAGDRRVQQAEEGELACPFVELHNRRDVARAEEVAYRQRRMERHVPSTVGIAIVGIAWVVEPRHDGGPAGDGQQVEQVRKDVDVAVAPVHVNEVARDDATCLVRPLGDCLRGVALVKDDSSGKAALQVSEARLSKSCRQEVEAMHDQSRVGEKPDGRAMTRVESDLADGANEWRSGCPIVQVDLRSLRSPSASWSQSPGM